MSIIIRLQNLPLSAKSGDIRHFFGGLRIPNGGVHIVGGDKGDAFIAFESDEDARLAMRKDGGKLMGSRVKLYLSSYMEMQHEIERITKEYPNDSDRLSPHERLRRRSPHRVHDRSFDNINHYRSESPIRSRGSYHTGRALSPPSRRSPRLRSRSPAFRSRSPRMRSRSPRLRSRSPRRRSRSPRIHGSRRSRSPLPRRSISPLPRSVSLRRSRSVSPYRNDPADYKRSFYESENGDDRNSYRDGRISRQGEYFKREGSSRDSDRIKNDLLKEEQAQLEKRITEVLKTGFDAIKKSDPFNIVPNTPDVPYSGQIMNSYFNPTHERGLQDNIHAYSAPKDMNVATSFPPPPLPNLNFINSQNMNMNNERFPNPALPVIPPVITSVPPPPLPLPPSLPPMNVPPPIQMPSMPPPVPVQNLPPPAPRPAMPPPLPAPPVDVPIPGPGFYITVSGLDPSWNFNEVQEMLKGTFVPLNNIKWEIDDHGMKTGTAFIKLSIREDFNHFLQHATYVYNGRLITVSECPSHVVHRYFLPEWPPKGPVDTSQNGSLYYRLKGLPYTVTYDDIIQFFQGLDITDIYIERENNVATGIGFVGFSNIQDYQEAYKLNGKNIGRRFVHMMTSSKKSMFKLKKKRGDLLSQSRVLIPSSVAPNNSAPEPSSQRRPLCILLTGLPPDITPNRLKNFFKNAGPIPDAIHVTLNEKGRPNCRAYAEFSSVRDFDESLKCHGTNMEGKIICVKQILFDEMDKILNTQRAMHFFEKNPVPNAPEKMPNMWQPPGGNRGPPMEFPPVDDKYRRMPADFEPTLNRPEVQVFEYGNKSREPTAVNIPYEQDNSFDLQRRQRKDPSPFGNEKWPLSNSSLNNRGRDDLFRSAKHLDSDRFINDRFVAKVEDFESNRDPVKFEVKTKQPMSKKSELSDAFDRSLKPEFKKKLTKLSPERSLVPEAKPSAMKIEKNLKDKKPDNSTKVSSSDRNVQKRDGRKSPDVFVSSKPRNEGNIAKSSRSEPKYKGRISEKRRDTYSYKSHPRSPSPGRMRSRSPSPGRMRSRSRRSRSLSPYSHDKFSRPDPYYMDEREAVVQISNVDPIVEGPELADFLRGFDVNHDKIIRRIDGGKRAWDIRVTFRNYREAERAIRYLNGSYINGEAVDMFFVD